MRKWITKSTEDAVTLEEVARGDDVLTLTVPVLVEQDGPDVCIATWGYGTTAAGERIQLTDAEMRRAESLAGEEYSR